jgi:hypothetical protein
MMPSGGGTSRETRDAMGFRAQHDIAAELSGKPPINPLWS